MRPVGSAPVNGGASAPWSLRSSDFVSVALVQSELCTQHLSRLSRRAPSEAKALGRRRCREAMPSYVLETRSFPHAVPLKREVLADGHAMTRRPLSRARGRGRDPGEPLGLLANGLERERVSNQGLRAAGCWSHDATRCSRRPIVGSRWASAVGLHLVGLELYDGLTLSPPVTSSGTGPGRRPASASSMK